MHGHRFQKLNQRYSTAFLPLFAQCATILGRRWPTIAAVGLFLIGSAISGGAPSTVILIVGRLTQGVGGAGITALTQLILNDLVSLRDLGTYSGIIYAVAGVGSALGPPLGGIVVQFDWRWIFWLNVPIGALSLFAHLLFLKLKRTHNDDNDDADKRSLFQKFVGGIDWTGNLILLCSVVSILVALSWADTQYSWSSWQIIMLLVAGCIGMGLFLLFEGSQLCKMMSPRAPPILPPRVFANRTAFAGLISTFLASILTMWRIYFLPVYLQAVLLVSPARAGVLVLPTMIIGMVAAVVAGGVLSHFGRYKPIHIFGFTVATLASGLYINFDGDSSVAEVVLYQVVAAIGGGCLLTTMLPSVQASHPPADTVASTSAWTFMRAFGNVWGLTIPAAIFNSQFESQINTISSVSVRTALGGGDGYSHVSASFITSLEPTVRAEVVAAYLASLKIVWAVCLGFNALGVALVFIEREIMLSAEVESDYEIKKVESVKLSARERERGYAPRTSTEAPKSIDLILIDHYAAR